MYYDYFTHSILYFIIKSNRQAHKCTACIPYKCDLVYDSIHYANNS